MIFFFFFFFKRYYLFIYLLEGECSLQQHIYLLEGERKRKSRGWDSGVGAEGEKQADSDLSSEPP